MKVLFKFHIQGKITFFKWYQEISQWNTGGRGDRKSAICIIRLTKVWKNRNILTFLSLKYAVIFFSKGIAVKSFFIKKRNSQKCLSTKVIGKYLRTSLLIVTEKEFYKVLVSYTSEFQTIYTDKSRIFNL